MCWLGAALQPALQQDELRIGNCGVAQPEAQSGLGAASRGSCDQGASPGASGEAWRLRPWRGLAWTVPSWLCSPSYLMSTLPELSPASCRHASRV